MKKIIGLFCFIILSMILMSGCSCKHEFSDWKVITPSSCSYTGTEIRNCIKCNDAEETRDAEILPHTYGEWNQLSAPSCIESGLEIRVCSVCNNAEARDIPVSDTHSYGSWIVVVESSCIEAGQKERECSTCGNIESEIIPISDHTWQPATCTTPKTCSRCEKTEGTPTNHSWAEATCTTPKTCSVCGETDGNPTGHNWKNATCTSAQTCTNCGAVQGSPLSHSFGKSGYCSRCGKKEEVDDYIYLARKEYNSIVKNHPGSELWYAHMALFKATDGNKYLLINYIFEDDATTYKILYNITANQRLGNPSEHVEAIIDKINSYSGSQRNTQISTCQDILIEMRDMNEESIVLLSLVSTAPKINATTFASYFSYVDTASNHMFLSEETMQQ